jgi:acyl-CoA thioesterase FadM
MGRRGFALHEALTSRCGWANVGCTIAYRRELPSGDLLVARSTALKLERITLTFRTRRVCALEPGINCSVLTSVTVHFELNCREAIELPLDLVPRLPRRGGSAT